MNKRMREIMSEIETKQEAAKSYCDTKEIDKASEVLDEIDTLKAEYAVVERAFTTEKENIDMEEVEIKTEPAVDSIKSFADAARRGFKSMNEGTPADGGYTVPEDISTKIQELREAKASLLDLVTVEGVSTNKGQRTFKKRSQQTGFTKVGEGGKIGATATPQFDRYTYEIEKYAGYLPVTNELLDDNDANVAGTIMNWIADESRVTANKLILAAIATKAQTEITGLDGIKEALNVTLGQAFKPTSVIVTNDDGLQYLDTLKDDDGKYLLQPSPADPMRLVLCAGATTVPVHVVPNADLATDGTKVPFIVGDLKEGITYFDRMQRNIMVSNIAAIGELNAFEEDLTIYRAIEREDVVTRDDEAFVNGYITVAAG